MSITLQLPSKRHADLRDAGIAGARGGVDLLAQGDLVGERDQRQRVVGAVHRLVGARRRTRRAGRCAGSSSLQGRGGALDRGGADLVGVGEGGGFAGHAAQAEPRGGVKIGGLQPAVVEAERLARADIGGRARRRRMRRGGARRGAWRRRGRARRRGRGSGAGRRVMPACPPGRLRARSGGRNSRIRRSPARGRCADRRAGGRARRATSPEPSQATAGEVTRMVSGGGMAMALRPSNRRPRASIESASGILDLDRRRCRRRCPRPGWR